MKNVLNHILIITLSILLLFTYSCDNTEPVTSITTTTKTPNLDSKLYGVWESDTSQFDVFYQSFSSNGKFFDWVNNGGSIINKQNSGDWWVQDGKLFKLPDVTSFTTDPSVYYYSFSGDTLILPNRNLIETKFTKQ